MNTPNFYQSRTHQLLAPILNPILGPIAVGLLILALAVPITENTAEAKPRTDKSAKKKSKKSKKSSRTKTRAMKVKRRGKFAGHGVQSDSLRGKPLPKPSGDIWVWSPNHREEIKVNIYNSDSSFSQESLAKLDNMFRCKRTQETRAVDPRLYEVLSIIQDHFAGKRVELTSGFRFQSNEGSRHFHASAMDVRVEGVSMRELYEFADSLDRGGMGIGKYPKSQFVHIDFRAPGEPSYRWTDKSKPGRGKRGRTPSKQWRKPKS